MSGSSLVKQIAMTIVADAGDAQSTIADLSAKGDDLAKPKTLVIAADTGEARGEVDAVSEALAKYDEAVTGAADASARLAEVQGEAGASAADVQAAADANTEAVLREREAWLSLGDAQVTAAARARETSDVEDESAGKTDAAGASAEGASSKLGLLALGIGAVGAVSIDSAMKVQAMSTELVTGAGQSAAGLKQVEAGMLAISAATATSSSQVEAGMYMIESAGYHGAAGLEVLQAAAEGAKVGGADLGTTADAVTTVLTDYKMSASGAAAATSGLVATVAAGKTHLQDLASSLSKVLPTASSLKVPFDQVAGAMATMTGEGVSARLAATHLNSTLLAMVHPNAAAQAAMEGVGLSSTQVANTLTHQGLIAALQMVTDAAGKKFPAGSAGYVAAVDTMLGGQSGLSVALEVTGKHLDTLKADTDSVAKAMHDGSSQVQGWGDVTKDASFKLDQAKTSAEDLGISVGSVLLPAVTTVMGGIADFTGKIADNKTAVDILVGVLVGALAAYAAVKVVDGFKKVAGTISDVQSGFSSLIAKITGSQAVVDEQAAATGELAVAQEEQAAASGEAAVAQGELDAAMDANPIGLIVIGIAGLIAVIVLLVTHLKDVEKVAKEVWKDVKDDVTDAVHWIEARFDDVEHYESAAFGLIRHDIASKFERGPARHSVLG